jgi:hypothetical protein
VKRSILWAADALLVLLLLGLLYMAALSLPTLQLLSRRFDDPALIFLLLSAAATYLLSHGARIVRLTLIVSDANVSLRQLTRVHLYTAGIGLGLPFKLGDAYRAGELALISGGAAKGIILVFVERVFDVALILVLIFFMLAIGIAGSAEYGPVLAASLTFVLLTALALVIVPDNLRRVSSYIIRRYDRNWSVHVLRWIAEVRVVLATTTGLLHGRYASLLVLTVMIWALEAAALAIVLAAFNSGADPLSSLVTFLSSVTEGRTLPDQLSDVSLASLPTAVIAYVSATQVPLLLVAIAAGLQLGAGRWRGRPRNARAVRNEAR